MWPSVARCLLHLARTAPPPTHTHNPFELWQAFGRRIPYAFLDDIMGRFFAAYGGSAQEVGWALRRAALGTDCRC